MKYDRHRQRVTRSMISEFAMLGSLPFGDEIRDCKDGRLTVHDIAKAARTTAKAAVRAIERHIAKSEAEGSHAEAGGAVLDMGGTDERVPAPETLTRAEMAAIVARRIGLIVPRPKGGGAPTGKAIPIKRLAAVSQQTGVPIEELRPDLSEVEIEMARGHPNGHAYRDEVRGRGLIHRHVPGGGHTIFATLVCATAGCRSKGEVKLRKVAVAATIDRKFGQQGWDVDPARCPSCKQAKHRLKPREITMGATTPTPAAIQAQAKMYGLLATHFDAENGVWGGGYSDSKVAEEAGVSPDLVAAVRNEAFGPLKEPPEITQLAADIEALTGLVDEAIAPIKTELGQLRTRLADLRRKFAA